jgi:hypothetical protein
MFLDLGTRPRRLHGAAVARVLLAVAGIHFYVSGFGARRFLWGTDGWTSVERFRSDLSNLGKHSLFTVSDAAVLPTLLWWVGISVALLFAVRGGRILAALHGVLLLSLYVRNETLLDGGDNFVSIAVWFLPLMHTACQLSPGADRRRLALTTSTRFRVRTLLHNVGTMVLMFQVGLIYVVASSSKLSSPNWRGGDALYYIARVEEFRYWSGLEWLTQSPVLTAAMTYGVIAVQILFVPLVVFRRTRIVGVLLVAGMHMSIMLTMGLVGFGLSILAGLALFVEDAQYAAAGAFARSVSERVRHWLSVRRRAAEPSRA